MDEVKKIYNIGDVTSIINSSGDSSNPIELSIYPSIEDKIYYPQENEYYSRVTVHAVTSDVDPSIIPENIRDGATILGVDGTFSGGSGGIDDISAQLISGTLEELDTTNTNITELRSGLFLMDTKLKRLVISPTMVTIGSYLFGAPLQANLSVSVLESLEFATDEDGLNYLSSIGNYAFYGCEKLTRIDFPEYLNSIGSHAFQACTSLRYVYIPASIQSIGNSAFKGCPLTEIYYGGLTGDFPFIEFGTDWFSNDTGELIVHCEDGDYIASLV